MKTIRSLLTFVVSLCLLAALPASAQHFDTANVKYEPSAQVGGATLQLNGAGIRYKAFFKVYTAGLYLNAKASTPEAVLANTGPKRLHIVMLREIDGNELGKLFTRGMEDNAPREMFAKSIPGTIRMGEIFSTRKKLTAGENFSVEYVPGVGTTVLVNGKPAGESIKEPEFFSSLLMIWLGKQPADRTLKESLLGRPPQRSGEN
ncbi:chalcone isomerase family protein [Aquabacterium sp.]|uniref:chalcone isomerase family protein n=1 Tax=Aquabacterium sp. TaxID=1872578 RepID=UPI003783B72F